jgi:hypothetical protein
MLNRSLSKLPGKFQEPGILVPTGKYLASPKSITHIPVISPLEFTETIIFSP